MHEASAFVAGTTVAAASAVRGGVAGHAANLAGGLHHAMRDAASGFCVYNDPAIAITWLLTQGAERIAYVDLDVYNADGARCLLHRPPGTDHQPARASAQSVSRHRPCRRNRVRRGRRLRRQRRASSGAEDEVVPGDPADFLASRVTITVDLGLVTGTATAWVTGSAPAVSASR